MPKYVLTDWEINGYNDSDFMLTYWDSESKVVKTRMHGTTRYGSCLCREKDALPKPTSGCSDYHLCAKLNYVSGSLTTSHYQVEEKGEWLLMPTATIVEDARVWLEEWIFNLATLADKRRVDEPQVEDLHEGLEVRLLTDCKMQVNMTEPCNKCNGSGKWINPRNPQDARDCFGCKGTGQHVTGKQKDDNGKLVFEKLTAGTFGKVVDWRSFGQFYSDGYNRPDRHNTTVQFRTDDGCLLRASLKNLRLHREYQSPINIRAKARESSFRYQFSSIYPRHAWDTYNFALQVAGR